DGVAVAGMGVGQSLFPRVRIVSDDAGGAVMAWFGIDGPGCNVHAQRVDASGSRQWSSDLLLCDNPADQVEPVLTNDGAGSVVALWRDNRNSGFDLFAQRFTLSGDLQWASAGVAVCQTSSDQLDTSVLPDGSGG